MASHSRLKTFPSLALIVSLSWLAGCSTATDSNSKPTPPKPASKETISPANTTPQRAASATELQQQRDQLDATLWAPEVQAQRHEETFISLWDQLRGASEARFDVARVFPFASLTFNQLGEATEREAGVRTQLLNGASVSLNRTDWEQLLDKLKADGYQIAQTEWHHAEFRRNDAGMATSVVTFAIDVARQSPAHRLSLRGKLDVVWEPTNSPDAKPVPRTLTLRDAMLVQQDGPTPFRPLLNVHTDDQHRRLMPVLLYDLNGDQLSEVILGGLNRIYWNRGQGKFEPTPLYANGVDMFDAAILADFNGDKRVDLVYVGPERVPMLLLGGSRGEFDQPPMPCAEVTFELPKSFTAGDIDQDGDLDLFIAQYKFPYVQGAMPTPFYDANDGFPAALLRNDGQGKFTDITAEAGLSAKRNRRTFSSSLVDLDEDRDLDLLTVNDFSGVDVYANDGHGLFKDVTSEWLDEKHLFGMGHTFADYNDDGRLDMYLIGMSSTTARRLDAMRLGRDDHPDINRMRQAMGYGNRMMLASPESAQHRYQQAPKNDQVCRTGWSWGTSSFDLENDGDPDIYVANGHTSGKSAKDYCTRYWCHDVYTGTSDQNPELHALFGASLRDLHQREISWNGFEHNFLWMNHGNGDFTNVAFPFGVGFEFDSRGVATDDLDNDGRPDLLVVQYISNNVAHAEYELHVMRNELTDTGHWIGVRLDESVTGRSPIGAVVHVTAGGKTYVRQIVTGDSFSTQHAPVAHFGLGDKTTVESLRVTWPDGSVQVVVNPAIDRYVPIGEFKSE